MKKAIFLQGLIIILGLLHLVTPLAATAASKNKAAKTQQGRSG